MECACYFESKVSAIGRQPPGSFQEGLRPRIGGLTPPRSETSHSPPRVWPRFEANENENAPRDVTGAEVVAFKLCGSVGVSPREVRVAVVNGSAGEVPRRTIVVVRETIVAVQRTALEARSIMVLVRVATHLVLASLGIVIVDL